MEFKDYYQTLGVSKTANEKEIKAAYRKLARKLHPDVNPGDTTAEARFKDLNEAYEVLGDAEKRRKYDELGVNWRQYEQAQRAGGGAAGAPFGGFGGWSVDMGGGGGYRTMSEAEMREAFGGDDPFSDFFHTFFGGRSGAGAAAGRGGPRSRRGRDLEHAMPLSLEEAFAGVTRRVSIASAAGGPARTVDVRIPAGVDTGSRVRVAGKGEPGTGGAEAGALYLTIQLRPHARFERRGRDLYVRLPVHATTAVLGGEAQVPTLEGGTVRLKIPEATQSGQVFRVKGRGMPVVKQLDERGDLYATVEIIVPHTISPEQRAHYEALRELERGGTTHSAA